MTMVCVERSCSQMFSSWLTGFFGRDGSSQLVAYVMYPTVDGMVWSCSIEKIATNLCTLGLNTWISTINRVSHLSWWLLVDVLFAPGAAMWWYRAHFQARSLENLGPSKNFDVHPGRLTWNLRTHPWKRKIIWTIIFGFYIYLRGCRKRRVSCDTYCGSNGLLHCYTCPKSQCGMKDKGICSRVCLWAENLFNQCYAAPICEVMSVEIFFMEGNKSLQEITLRKTNMTMEN